MPVAVTTSSKLTAETNAVILSLGPYLSSDDPRVMRWFREADKLVKANAVEAWRFRAIVNQLIGDVEQARYCIDNAINLNRNDPIMLETKCVILSNLGEFSEAQEAYERSGSPRLGLYPKGVLNGKNCGATRQIAQYIEEARKLNLEVSSLEPVEIEAAARLMEKHGFSDSDVGRVLDVAGEILRECKVMFLGQIEVFSFDAPDDPALSFVIKLPFDAYKCEELDTELASRLVGQRIPVPWLLSVNFVSGLIENNERYPDRNSEARV